MPATQPPESAKATYDRPPSGLPAAILFDLDGTLVDSEPKWSETERGLAEKYGSRWTEADAFSTIGNPLAVTVAEMRALGLPLTNEEAINEIVQMMVAHHRAGVEWMAGVEALLETVRSAQIPAAIVSASFRSLVDAVLAAAPGGVFHDSVAGDEVHANKPDPEPYLTGASRLGVAIGDCLVIEDSVSGATSGVVAGAHVLVVPSNLDHLDDFERLGASITTSLELVGIDELSRMHAGERLRLGL
ncbi:HAD family hydrolase [Gulosibacter faecalis]|uniref:HAD family hydrolase n=1 Tax=Gulosibacter faecalis TaxID=272240 RepID=A0ABW5V384_9MICO|nr:HAD family phosphatase [Gulosibacter faecalis]